LIICIYDVEQTDFKEVTHCFFTWRLLQLIRKSCS